MGNAVETRVVVKYCTNELLKIPLDVIWLIPLDSMSPLKDASDSCDFVNIAEVAATWTSRS